MANSTFNLSSLNSIDADDRSGLSVSGAGDIITVDVDDLIIGALQANPNGRYSGESYVVFCNTPPQLDLNGSDDAGINFAATRVGGPVTIVDSDLTLTDNSPNIASATVTITNLLDGAAEVLAAATTGTDITVTYINGTLTLTGLDTVANYQQVLRTVTYDNTNSTPILLPELLSLWSMRGDLIVTSVQLPRLRWSSHPRLASAPPVSARRKAIVALPLTPTTLALTEELTKR